MNYLWRLFATLSLCGTIVSLGIALVVHGATLLQLQSAFSLDMTQISLIFPAFGVGTILGTFPAGADIGGRGRRRHVISFFVAATAGVMMGIIPHAIYIELLIIAFTVFGFSYGYLDTVLTTAVTDLWGDDSESYLVALRSSSSIGVFIGGFICVPFVEPVTNSPINITNLNHNVIVTSPSYYDVTTTHNSQHNSAGLLGLSQLEMIYLISMSLILMTSLFMLIMMMMTSRRRETSEEEQRLITGVDGSFSPKSIGEELQRRERVMTCSDVVTVVLLCVVVGSTNGTTGAFCNYIASFATVYLKRPPEDGALIVSLYGGSTLISNLLVTVLVKAIRPKLLVILTFSSALCAFIVMSIIPHESFVIWMITAMFGVGNVPTMCLTYVCAEKYGYLTMKVAGAFAFSSGLAAFLSTLITGSMFDIDPMFLMYYCLGCSVAGPAAFSLAMLTNKRSTPMILDL